MATAARIRAPVITVTPTRDRKSKFSQDEKQSLLDNLDLEIADKTRAFRSSLSATLESFLRRQETEMLRVPREMRKMKVGDVGDKWGGDWGKTLQRITKERIDTREKEEAEAREKVAASQDEAKGKRKRSATVATDATPRRAKSARRAQTPSTARRAPGSGSAAGKRKTTSRSKGSSTASNSQAGPSSIPQDYKFNPSIPPSILLSHSSTSAGPTHNHIQLSDQDPPSDSSMEPSSDMDDTDLPDAEAYEAKILAKSTSQSSRSQPSNRSQPSQHSSKSAPVGGNGRMKRAPSLVFRQSLAPGEFRLNQSQPAPPSTSMKGKAVSHQQIDNLQSGRADGEEDGEEEEGDEENVMKSIKLSNGQIVTFNPLKVDPNDVRAEIAQAGGMSEAEQAQIAMLIREESVKALMEKMNKWKVI